MPTATIPEALNVALQFHQGGNLQQAEAIYQQILQADPNHADAMHLMGVIAHQVGRNDLSIQYIHQALRLQPTNAAFHSNLGEAYRASGQLVEAVAHYQEAIRLQPDCAAAHNNLGEAFRSQKRLMEAVQHYQEALRYQPNTAQTHYNLGNVLWELGRLGDAAGHYQEALRIQPDSAEAHNNLGLVLQAQGRLQEAIAHYQEALRYKPNLAEVYYNLGLALTEMGDAANAEVMLRQALQLRPDSAEIYNDLGIAYKDQGKLEQAIACYEQSIRLNPQHVGAHNNLGIALQDQGKIVDAEPYFHEALRIQPSQVIAHSNLLRLLSYNPQVSAQQLFEEHLRWAKVHSEPLLPLVKPHSNDRNPDRRIRVGYVSPDFREHPVARLVEPVLANHDHSQFEVFCYSNVRQPDAVTRQLQQYTDQWRSLVGWNDDQAAEVIRQDGIDILVDLAGHTAGNRILVFARKPAPVQVSHFGYANTTGMTTMDYRITDPYSDPPGMTEKIHTEELYRLPEVAYCYQPTASPDVGPLPALMAGHITFASFNYLGKITPDVVQLWSKIMHALPGSRLLLLSGAVLQGVERVRDLFDEQGIKDGRVEFLTRKPREQYLQFYNAVDIGLDPFPYNGGITTCDTLWMSVPMVILAGVSYIARQGVVLLSNVGLRDWIAETPEQYADIAIRWSKDLDGLQEIRQSLRDRVKNSPLTDNKRFTRNLEAAYRDMWRRWCTRNP